MARERDDRNDRQVFADLAVGRSGALGEAYDRHAASLFRHACALARSRADAEDLVHTVFVKLALMGPELLSVRRPASYLHRMLHSTWLDGYRRGVVGERILEEMAPAVDHVPWYAAAESMDVARAIDALPIEQREVVELHVVEGFSFREVGGLTGVSMFTASGRYRMALAKLKRLLDPERK